MARPTKLTDQVQATIIAALEAGATYDLAAQCAGINPATFYRWKQRGEEGDSDYVVFAESVELAGAVALVDALKTIKAASADPKYWQAAAWLLERRLHEDFGRHLSITPPASAEAQAQLDKELKARIQGIFDARWKAVKESGDIAGLSDFEVRVLLVNMLAADAKPE